MNYLKSGGAWPGKMRDIVLFKADGICEDFWNLLTNDDMFRQEFGIVYSMGCDHGVVCECIGEAVLLVTLQSVDFDRRIRLNMTNNFPLQLAWLTYQPHDVSCDFRRDLARRLLLAESVAELNDDDLTFKFRLLFEAELIEAVESGMLHRDVWQLTFDIMAMTTDNTQDIEGLNSILSHIVKLSPNIGFHASKGYLLTVRDWIMHRVGKHGFTMVLNWIWEG